MTQTPLTAQVSLFSGSTNVTPVETVPLADVLQRIQDGIYQPHTAELRRLLATEGKARYDAAKKHSVAFTPAGVFVQRANAKLTTASGVVHFDFDHPDNLAEVKARLIDDPYVVYAFTSPSGDGLKVAVWADGIMDDVTYKNAWGTVLHYFERTYPDLAVANDPHCKDVSRLCYVSYDPDLHRKPDALLFAVPAYQPPAPKPKLTPQPTSIPLPGDRRQRYAQQAIETATEMIDASIPPTATSSSTRHATRLKAARLLGGYVAGGILDYSEAYAALEAAVGRNTDNMPTSMKTIADGLRHGQDHPITLDELEAERLDWLQAHRATLVVHQNGSTTPPAPDASQPQTGPTAAAATHPTVTGSGQTCAWGTPGQQASDPRPDIIIGPDITRIVDEAQAALLALPDTPIIYQRARRLCVIARGVKPPRWLHRPQDIPVSIEASPAHLWELAGQAAKWWKLDKRAKKYEQALPPRWFVEALQGRGAWPFPSLEGIVYSPTLRPDGSLLDTPGYDPDTGLYLDPNGIVHPTIPDHPTLDDARTAIGRLQEPLIDFPFAESWHFSATLAAVLSLGCRFTVMGNVPLFAIRANTRGSGKSLLADVVSIIGTGRAAPRWPQVTEDEEERKRLLTVALAGYPVIHIDNVTRPLGSPALDLALTASSFSDRILGKHDSREAPLSMVWLASGNNMQFQGDTARRILPIDLDPKMERPEERTGFQHNPLPPWVQQERPRFTVAALTILRAYFEAGCPAQGVTPWGSFEQWSDLVRQALIWAGEADPCEGRKGIEAESDPQYEQLAVLLDAWAQCYPRNDPWTLAQVKGDIQTRCTLPPQPPNQWNALQEALGAFDKKYDGKSLNTHVLDYEFRKFQGRTITGRRFVTGGTLHKVQRWVIEHV